MYEYMKDQLPGMQVVYSENKGKEVLVFSPLCSWRLDHS